MRERIREYVRDPADDDKSASPPIPSLDGDEADVYEAWKMYVWMEATGGYHLPAAGGLEDQDEMLMNNIFAIRVAVRRMKGDR